MSAGMHDTVIGGGVCAASLLTNRQRVHVSAQCNSTRAATTAQCSNDTGSCETTVDADAELRELRGDEVGGAAFLERHFRMRMDIVPPRRHIGMGLGDAIKDGHESLRELLRPVD
jgi:hypothetical protein